MQELDFGFQTGDLLLLPENLDLQSLDPLFAVLSLLLDLLPGSSIGCVPPVLPLPLPVGGWQGILDDGSGIQQFHVEQRGNRLSRWTRRRWRRKRIIHVLINL